MLRGTEFDSEDVGAMSSDNGSGSAHLDISRRGSLASPIIALFNCKSSRRPHSVNKSLPAVAIRSLKIKIDYTKS